MTILFLNLQITRSDIRPHIKWTASLVIAYGHFNLPRGFVWICVGMYVLTYSLYHPPMVLLFVTWTWAPNIACPQQVSTLTANKSNSSLSIWDCCQFKMGLKYCLSPLQGQVISVMGKWNKMNLVHLTSCLVTAWLFLLSWQMNFQTGE